MLQGWWRKKGGERDDQAKQAKPKEETGLRMPGEQSRGWV
jgi:hypothetical protein